MPKLGGVSSPEIEVLERLKKFFRPEMLNRLDDVTMFEQLSRYDLKKILEIMLNKVYGRLKKYYKTVDIKNSAKTKLIEEGYDPLNGARPLRRCITRVLEDRLAQWIADEQVKEGDSIAVDLDVHGSVVMRQVMRLLTPQARAKDVIILGPFL